MNFILSRLIELRDSEINKTIKNSIINNKCNILMNNRRIDEISLYKKDNMTFKINKISEKLHMFNPLLTLVNSTTEKIFFNDNSNYKLSTPEIKKSNLFTTSSIHFCQEDNTKIKLIDNKEKTKMRNPSKLMKSEESRENSDENLDSSLQLFKFDSLNTPDKGEKEIKNTFKEDLKIRLIRKKPQGMKHSSKLRSFLDYFKFNNFQMNNNKMIQIKTTSNEKYSLLSKDPSKIICSIKSSEMHSNSSIYKN